MNRRIAIRIVKFCRSTCDVQMRSSLGRPSTTLDITSAIPGGLLLFALVIGGGGIVPTPFLVIASAKQIFRDFAPAFQTFPCAQQARIRLLDVRL